jgi:hypothetical protein
MIGLGIGLTSRSAPAAAEEEELGFVDEAASTATFETVGSDRIATLLDGQAIVFIEAGTVALELRGAGGGGGGGNGTLGSAGGGGAGEIVQRAEFAVTAQTYTATVWAAGGVGTRYTGKFDAEGRNA